MTRAQKISRILSQADLIAKDILPERSFTQWINLMKSSSFDKPVYPSYFTKYIKDFSSENKNASKHLEAKRETTLDTILDFQTEFLALSKNRTQSPLPVKRGQSVFLKDTILRYYTIIPSSIAGYNVLPVLTEGRLVLYGVDKVRMTLDEKEYEGTISWNKTTEHFTIEVEINGDDLYSIRFFGHSNFDTQSLFNATSVVTGWNFTTSCTAFFFPYIIQPLNQKKMVSYIFQSFQKTFVRMRSEIDNIHFELYDFDARLDLWKKVLNALRDPDVDEDSLMEAGFSK